jgi:iron complex transport system permease protein
VTSPDTAPGSAPGSATGTAPAAVRRRSAVSTATLVTVGLLVLALTMAIALGRGPVEVPVPTVVEVAARRLRLFDAGVSLSDDQIVWQLRLPRVLASAAVGAVLAVCGCVLQSLTRNDLADPYLLGISGGAAVGAVTVIVLGVSVVGLVGTAAVTAAAFAGAIASLLLVLALAAGRGGALEPARTVLAGVAIGQACAAYTSFVVILPGDSHAASRVLRWTLGSVAGVRARDAVLLAVVALLVCALAVPLAGWLDAFAFGDATATSLGVDVTRLRWSLLAATALATATMVAYAGIIGFVGLIVPHLVRLVVGPGHRRLLPLAAIVGATLLVWADVGARTLVPGEEIPIGVVTGVVGAPAFAWLLHRTRRRAG